MNRLEVLNGEGEAAAIFEIGKECLWWRTAEAARGSTTWATDRRSRDDAFSFEIKPRQGRVVFASPEE